jgi:DNA-directed RNA polymerase specialized sigma24 family protein
MPRGQPGLEQISTHWPQINDPVLFAMRYAEAIRKYLEALLKNPHDAEEVTQEFLLRGILKGFLRTTHLRGRFRDYIKVAARNAGLNQLKRKQPTLYPDPDQLPAQIGQEAEEEWVADWRRCVLDRVWQALDNHQRASPGNLAHTVLRLAVDHPDEDSTALAARASAQTGHSLRPAAFRKQLSRARHLFAELVLAEVAQTIQEPTADRVEEELHEVGLMHYIRDYLPDDWKTTSLFEGCAAKET